MDESRKQFEEWWDCWFGEAPVTGWFFIRIKDGGYTADRINDMWEAWQASRESLRKQMEIDDWDLN